jgi:hypothetical protein
MSEQPAPKVIEPTHIAGASPGATYRIVARTDGGYIAVRRVGGKAFRIRAERWDHAPLVVKGDEASIDKIQALRMGIRDNGARISGMAVGKMSLERAVAILLSILIDKAFDENLLEIQAETGIDGFEKHAHSCPGCKKFYGLEGPAEKSADDATPTEMSHLPPNGSEPN